MNNGSTSLAAKKLAAVLEAQATGGYKRHRFAMRPHHGEICLPGSCKVLYYLLDPKGLKAIWDGSQEWEHIDVRDDDGSIQRLENCDLTYKVAANSILEAWLSGGSLAAIDAAHTLLPRSEY